MKPAELRFLIDVVSYTDRYRGIGQMYITKLSIENVYCAYD